MIVEECMASQDVVTYTGQPEEEPVIVPNTLGDVLDEAKKIINGQRQNEYGTPEDSFQRIADYWNTYLNHIGVRYLEPEDVAFMMVLFKLAREEHEHKRDNLTDLIGYAALANDLIENSR